MLRLVVTASGTGPIEASNADVHREIGQRHHGRAGDRAARPDELRLIGLPHPAAAVPDLLDREPACRVERLRELGGEEALELAATVMAGFGRSPPAPLRAFRLTLAAARPAA